MSILDKGVGTACDGEDIVPDGIASGRIDKILLHVAIVESGEERVETLPIDAIVCENGGYSIEEAVVLVARDSGITPKRLVDLIHDTLFSASEDHEADSWETQASDFRRDARHHAVSLLRGEEAALLESMRSAIIEAVVWRIPKDRTLIVEAAHGVLAIRFAGDRQAA